ncbi:unnamed protein product, partial [marine sediment metagenome]
GIAKVEFYVDDEYLGELTEEPFEWEYTGSGSEAQAIAYDNAGNSAASEKVNSQNQIQSSSNSVLDNQCYLFHPTLYPLPRRGNKLVFH